MKNDARGNSFFSVRSKMALGKIYFQEARRQKKLTTGFVGQFLLRIGGPKSDLRMTIPQTLCD